MPPPGAASFHQGRPLVSRASSPRQALFVGGIIGSCRTCPQFLAESARRTHAGMGTWSLWPDSNRRPLRAISSPPALPTELHRHVKRCRRGFPPRMMPLLRPQLFRSLASYGYQRLLMCLTTRIEAAHTGQQGTSPSSLYSATALWKRGGRLDCHTLAHRRSVIRTASNRSLSAANAVFSDRCFLVPCWSYPS